MFNIPVKDIIVNDDSQVRLLGSTDGSTWAAYTGSTNLNPATAAHRFSLEGFLTNVPATALQLLASATRVRQSNGTAAVAGIAAFTVTAVGSGPQAGDVFMIRMDADSLSPTEFQDKGFEKRYQFTSAKATAATIVAHMVATINADKAAPVIAYEGETADAGKIVLVSKRTGVSIEGLYMSFTVPANSFTVARVANGVAVDVVGVANQTTVAGSLGNNNYEVLKSVNWAKNFSIDQNISWMPLPGNLYNGFYFEVNGPLAASSGNDQVPNEPHTAARTGYMLYVKAGLTLDTALQAFLTDVNV